jgi:hypothetical protein
VEHRYQRHCEERLRRSNPDLAYCPWIASLALAMTVLDVSAKLSTVMPVVTGHETIKASE